MADNLREILEIAKRQMPEVPADVWARIEGLIRIDFGGQRPYIAAHRKRAHLEALAAADEQQSAAALAEKLGVSVRRVQQLKRLR